MGGGNTQTQTTRPQLPPELSGLYQGMTNVLTDMYRQMPVSNYMNIPTQQFAGYSPEELQALGVYQGMLQQPGATAAATDVAGRMAEGLPYRPVDLGAAGQIGGFQFGGGQTGINYDQAGPVGSARVGGAGGYQPAQGGGGGAGGYQMGGLGGYLSQFGVNPNQQGGQAPPFQMPGEYQAQGFQPLTRVQNPLANIDYANNPEMKAAMASFDINTAPQVANAANAMGIGRSGAAGQMLADARTQAQLPIIQNINQNALQWGAQDVGQRNADIQAILGARGQDVGAGTTQRGQTIEGLLGARGQDLGQNNAFLNAAMQAYGTDIGSLLQARGQDIGQQGQMLQALLGQGAQGLEARGQNLQGMQGALQGYTGIGAQDIGRLMGAGQAIGGAGATQRSISDAEYAAQRAEQERQANMAMQMLLAPLGGLTSQIGQTTTMRGGK